MHVDTLLLAEVVGAFPTALGKLPVLTSRKQQLVPTKSTSSVLVEFLIRPPIRPSCPLDRLPPHLQSCRAPAHHCCHLRARPIGQQWDPRYHRHSVHLSHRLACHLQDLQHLHLYCHPPHATQSHVTQLYCPQSLCLTVFRAAQS